MSVITYYLTVTPGGSAYAWARVMQGDRPVDFLCTSKRNWVLDATGDLMGQLMVMPDLGFQGEITPEALDEAGFPPLTEELIESLPYLRQPRRQRELLDAGAVLGGLTESWRHYAIVDELAPDNVLHLIRLAAGPRLQEYDRGEWRLTPGMLARLVDGGPSALVEVDDVLLEDLMRQIDRND